MKKLFFSLSAMIIAINSFAQYNVGDLCEFEGVPCIVVKVDDEDGEHGLAMTFRNGSAVTKVMESLGITNEMMMAHPMKYALKIWGKSATELAKFEKTVAPYYVEVAPRLSKSGEQNAEAIKTYCEEKGIKMEDVFPDQAWAAGLGEGWFVPGDDELALYASLISPGLNVKTPEDSFKKIQALQEKSNAIEDFILFFPCGNCMVYSSSLTCSAGEARRHFLFKQFYTGLKVQFELSIYDKTAMGVKLVNCPNESACYKF